MRIIVLVVEGLEAYKDRKKVGHGGKSNAKEVFEDRKTHWQEEEHVVMKTA